MKISQPTISLLKSFASINSNLLIREGNNVSTRNATGSIQARATVEETFPRTIPIYDLNQLLGLISVSADADIEFENTYMLIRSSNGGVIRYYYAEESLIKPVPEQEPEIQNLFGFQLTSSEISVIQKTASIVAATTFTVESKAGYVSILIGDPKNPTSNSYSKTVGECDTEFSMRVSIDNIRPIVDDTYDVTLGFALAKNGAKVPVFRFTSVNKTLKYLIAAEKTN